MKLLSPNQICPRRMAACAFTLAEMLIAFWVFSILVVAAICAIQLFALRIYTLAATKLSATETCRKTLNAIRDQIREANFIDVGNCTSTPSSFNSLATNKSQIGNSVIIYPTVKTNVYATTYDANQYSLFYLDMVTNTNNYQMTQFTVSSNALGTALVTNTKVLAGYITNQDIFTAEGYDGTILTNEQTWTKREMIRHKVSIFPMGISRRHSRDQRWGSLYDYYQLGR